MFYAARLSLIFFDSWVFVLVIADIESRAKQCCAVGHVYETQKWNAISSPSDSENHHVSISLTS